MGWHEFWFGGKELPFWAFGLRAFILYVCLIIATRFMRQRQIGILSGHNYLVAAGIVSLAAVRMVNPEASLLAGIAIIFTYAGINVLWSYLDLKFPKQIDRHSIKLIENGKLIKKNLSETHVTIDNLIGQLRLKDVHNLSEVTLAILEPTGKINVVKKTQALPVTRKQMKLPLKNIGLSTVLIYDGKIQEENLKNIGKDVNWLNKKIREKGFLKSKDVFLALLESDGTVYTSA
jgi:uncharacterized membrane protein YcaP (DUF421 family)